MIEITERSRVIWFMPISETSDFMGHIGINEQGKPQFDYRFRHYGSKHQAGNPGDPFIDDDKKNWYRVLPQKPMSVDEFERVVRGIVGSISALAIGPLDEIRNTHGVTQMMADMCKRPWAHMKQVGGTDAAPN